VLADEDRTETKSRLVGVIPDIHARKRLLVDLLLAMEPVQTQSRSFFPLGTPNVRWLSSAFDDVSNSMNTVIMDNTAHVGVRRLIGVDRHYQ